MLEGNWPTQYGMQIELHCINALNVASKKVKGAVPQMRFPDLNLGTI